jgi:hypothetical protein
VHGVAVEQTSADACLATAGFEVQRQHVRRFDRPGRREPRADRLSTTVNPAK